MAQPAVTGGALKALIGVLVVVVILVGAIIGLVNLTPRQLGLQGAVIQGKTLDEHGLADYKFKEIIEAFKDLTKDAEGIEEQLVENRVDGQSQTKAEENLKGGTAESSGKIDYTSLYQNKVYYSESKQIEYTDDSLGAIMNNVLSSASISLDGGAKEVFLSNAGIEALAARSVGISGVTVKIAELTLDARDGKINMRIIAIIDLTQIRNDPAVKEILDKISGLVKIPDPLKVVAEINVELVHDKANNTIAPSGNGTVIIQNSRTVTDILFSVQNQITEDGIASYLGDAVCRIINNLGKVTSVENGKIVFQTYTRGE